MLHSDQLEDETQRPLLANSGELDYGAADTSHENPEAERTVVPTKGTLFLEFLLLLVVVPGRFYSGANHGSLTLECLGQPHMSYSIVISSIKALSILKRTCHLQQSVRLHAIQIFTMSSSNTLQLEHIIEDYPKDTQPYPAETSPLLHEDTRSEMPPKDRSGGRNVHIFDNSDRSTSIGGLFLTAGITNANLYAMIEIFVIFEGEYSLRNESNITIDKNDSPLLPGNYYIVSSHLIQISDETPLTRLISLQTGTRIQAFTDAVRLRDKRCVISGKKAISVRGLWSGFEAAHIFPLAYEGLWKDWNFGRWIISPPNGEEIKGGKINSEQNGLLLRSDIHQLFNMYIISINPDDDYKIVCFDADADGIAGKHFDQRPLDDPQRPADELLRWHFRQAVLTNIKGAGEPVFEHDYPAGSDIVGSILNGPKAPQVMEFALFSRLATQFDLTE